LPGFALTLRFSLFPFLYLSISLLLSHLPPLHCGAALHRFRAPIRGVAERRQAPGCALSTRCAFHSASRTRVGALLTRHAGHHARRPTPERRGLASRRSTVAISGPRNALPHAAFPSGSCRLSSPSLSASGRGLGRRTFRTGHIDPKDRCATSRARF